MVVVVIIEVIIIGIIIAYHYGTDNRDFEDLQPHG